LQRRRLHAHLHLELAAPLLRVLSAARSLAGSLLLLARILLALVLLDQVAQRLLRRPLLPRSLSLCFFFQRGLRQLLLLPARSAQSAAAAGRPRAL